MDGDDNAVDPLFKVGEVYPYGVIYIEKKDILEYSKVEFEYSRRMP